ncbi:LytTR family transcriptional regulator [Companilactobacillus zhachilii]|uniref:LytTR family DNA-binding domain-containing protein n=1 Tax=Companilactobacillus zhachilii TaxID=2304606 RepID=UPI0019210CFF|nr:LytTR family DNA-binding domain-containing protein [Companilactobacillus zhachilii]MBL3530298.1 LytTR family transcriptional regulator [Companilactobacillus zhachilii]
MKVNFNWDALYSLTEIGMQLNPQNYHLKNKLESFLSDRVHIEVINPKNERRSLLDCSQILSIEAMDSLSKVYTINNEVFYTKGRLKNFEILEGTNLFRINNNVVINLAEVTGFKTGKYAQLEVFTKEQQVFIVSRHYAKKLKEELISVPRIEK